MTRKASKTFGCPACGMRVTGKEKKCPRCGKKFGKAQKFECPFCGELILESSLKCPECNSDLSAISDKAKSKVVDKTMNELMGDLIEFESSQVREEEVFSCPTCGELLSGKETKCPKCGQVLVGKLGLQCPICGTSIEKGFRQCPRCGISLEKASREAKSIIPFDSRSKGGLGGEARVAELADSRPCPFCGAIIPVTLTKCPLCNTTLPGAGPVEQGAMEAQVQRPLRERKLKAAKVTTVPVSAQTGGRGLTNGVGQVNGLGKVNGTGVTNGRSFVNGTGISNGLGPRSEEGPGKRRSLVTRWQFLAVLVAVIIVIPTFIFLSYSDGGDKFSIDGDFGEWEDATMYGTKIQSTSTTSNITEWAVATQSSDLYLYFRTQAHMMSSADAESYYLFVDSDGSNATGYVMGSLGADYMLQLTGWDSAVNSTSLSQYSSSDQYNWSAWTSIGSLSYSLDLVLLEARATMPVELGPSAKFVLVSKDSSERGSVSYAAPLKGGLLIVRQAPSDEVAADGIVPRSVSTPMLTLKFTCEGEDGQVTLVTPALVGAPLTYQEPAFSLKKGEERQVTISVDTSAAIDGQHVSAKVLASGITSSFASVEIIGDGASAYAGAPPSSIAIDGAFADWAGRLSVDQDSIPVTIPSVDIDEVGNLSTSLSSFFYVSVEGEMCSGTFVPAMVTRPTGAGGGVVIPTKHTAEDILTIYVDSDNSDSTGQQVALDWKQIGADQKIEVKGLFGEITSMREFDFSSSSGVWVESYEPIHAAKDSQRIEIQVTTTSLGGSSNIDFIVETTSWKGRSDMALFDPSSMRALTRTWLVDSLTTSPFATSMSYQRKMFYDGVNYWSFFFDGTNTVYKYSVDEGTTWTYGGPVFTTPGVNETSIWYDSASSTVYAVGDTSLATNNVSIQVGAVDAAAHAISWAAIDFSLNTSSFPVAGKNTYICKDASGHLWVLSSNLTQLSPALFQLSAFRSSAMDNAASWTHSGEMLVTAAAADNVKGSIVPAGPGKDVWAVYTYAGNVVARKFIGTWGLPEVVYAQAGSKANTDNSPPSVVVDSKGVLHVVYGTGRRAGPASAPTIEYSHNESGLTTFTPGLNLDPLIAQGIGDYFPTITLDSSTGDLYVFWLQSDATLAPKTVMGRKCVSGTWSDMTIEPQTSFTKQFLTSAYSAPGEFKICWQWTQNVTAPIELIFDRTEIPEFGDLALPILGTLVVVAVSGLRFRKRNERA